MCLVAFGEFSTSHKNLSSIEISTHGATLNAFRFFKTKLLPLCSQDVIMLQETHLTSLLTQEGDSLIDRAHNDFKKFGYRCTISPARTTSKGGTSGGVAIAWKADRRAMVFENIVPGRANGALVSFHLWNW